MQEKFSDTLNVNIYTTFSEEAKGYTFKSSTNVLLGNEWVPLDVAIDKNKMENLLLQKYSQGEL